MPKVILQNQKKAPAAGGDCEGEFSGNSTVRFGADFLAILRGSGGRTFWLFYGEAVGQHFCTSTREFGRTFCQFYGGVVGGLFGNSTEGVGTDFLGILRGWFGADFLAILREREGGLFGNSTGRRGANFLAILRGAGADFLAILRGSPFVHHWSSRCACDGWLNYDRRPYLAYFTWENRVLTRPSHAKLPPLIEAERRALDHGRETAEPEPRLYLRMEPRMYRIVV